MRKFTLLVLTGLLCFTAFGQQRFFTNAGANKEMQTTGLRTIIPNKFNTFTADVQALRSYLWSLPSEASVKFNHNSAPVIELPMPDGKLAKFNVWESSIMEPGLAAKFPEMKTFAGQGIDDPFATIRFSYDPYFGFRGQILSAANGRVFIDPYARHDINSYISYFASDAKVTEHFICEMPETNRPEQTQAGPCRGLTLLTYRLALACTVEYATAVCMPNPPTVPATGAEMLNAVNRVTGVYEHEVSVRMVLVANNDLLIYTSNVPTPDPYTNNNGPTMLGQNQTNVDNVIGAANYDIGHVFSTGGGGVAGLGVVCTAGVKARGVTGLPNPVGDDFYIDYVAHEMGHQFGGDHTFNSVTSNCGGGNRNGPTAYEVGSGTSIQAYAGICGGDDIQPHSDPFFHTVSFDQIGNYVTSGGGAACPTSSATGNILPVITAMNNNNISIPSLTPFTLTGSATDANGDAITYCWEEWDLGTGGAWNNGAASTTAPLFKSRIPLTTGSRTFPSMAVILAGYPASPAATMGGLKGETLPSVARAIKFRLTVRDNRAGGGGVVTGGDGCHVGFTGQFTVNVTSSAPFLVTVPNGGESYAGGSTQTITWNPAQTAAAPISVANVKISLSTDGGLTYPTVITASTPNDGSEALTIPVGATATARIKIEAVGNIFFDISNNNFSIVPPASGFTLSTPAPVSSTCPTPATLTTNTTATYSGGHTADITLSASNVPAGTTVTFGTNPLTTGSTTTTINLNNANTLPPGTYNINILGVSPPAANQTVVATFIITPATGPAITQHPTDQTVCVGSPATFTVTSPTATGFQWYVNTGAGFNIIPGATSASYTIPAVTGAQNGNLFRVIASTACATSTSNSAVLNVSSNATINTHPANVTICEGADATFSVGATSPIGTINYQWQVNNGAGWVAISGATSSTYTRTAVPVAQNGYQFRVVLTTACGTITSNPATLTVNAYPVFTLTGLPKIVCLSDPSFTLQASLAGGIWSGTGVTGSTFSPVGAGLGVKTVTYTATNAGCATAVSSTVTVNECPERHRLLPEKPAVLLYPNPNNGIFSLRMNSDLYTKLSVKVFDAQGRLYMTKEFNSLVFGSIMAMDLTRFGNGTYYLYMYNSEKGFVSRGDGVVIMR